MPLYPYTLYCQRIDDSRNMARYYALAIQSTLFGEVAVTRAWGRIGKGGREMTDTFPSEHLAALHFLELARLKQMKGYRPVSLASGASI